MQAGYILSESVRYFCLIYILVLNISILICCSFSYNFLLTLVTGVGSNIPIESSPTIHIEALSEVIALNKLAGDFVRKMVLSTFSEVLRARTLRVAVESTAAARVVRCMGSQCVGCGCGCGRPGGGGFWTVAAGTATRFRAAAAQLTCASLELGDAEYHRIG